MNKRLADSPKNNLSLVVEVPDILHVAEDDVLLVGDARRNLLHTAAHLPQVVLTHRHTDRQVR